MPRRGERLSGTASRTGVSALVLCLFLPASAPARGGVPSAPAEDRVSLRFAVIECRLSPAAVEPGGEAKLEISLRPLSGLTWHEAPLRPSRVAVRAPERWEAEPPSAPLPPAGHATGPRAAVILLRAGADAAEGEGVELRLSYGVRDARGGVFFEDATISVAVPVEAPRLPVRDAESPAVRALLPRSKPDESPAAGREGASPVLPALFFVLASALVFCGIALWMRKSRRGR
jgi:hypothetical protein